MARLSASTIYGKLKATGEAIINKGLEVKGEITSQDTVRANNGIEVEGGTIDQHATVRASSGADSGHLMIDSNGGNLYLNRTDNGSTRINGGQLEDSLNANDQLIYNVDSLRDNAANCELVFDSGSNRFEFEDGSGNRTEALFSRVYLENGTGWFTGNHADLSGVGSSDHHAKYTDANARSAIESGNVQEVNFEDRDNDGNYWRVIEDGANGHLRWDSVGGGSTQMDLEHNGNLRIEGEITEGSAL